MFETRFTAEWGDRGLSQREIRRRYGAVTAIIDTGAQFRTPVRYGDKLAVAVGVAEWQERRFKLCYRIFRGAELTVEAIQLRAWALMSGEGRLRSAPIDPELRRLLA